MLRTLGEWIDARLRMLGERVEDWHQRRCDSRRRLAAKTRPTARPRLEPLEDRLALSTDYWQPTAQGSAAFQYNVDVNWSENHKPLAGEDVVWDSAHNPNNNFCIIPGGLVLPEFNSLTFANDAYYVQANSNLTASTITLQPRTNPPAGTSSLVIGFGATVEATSALAWNGGAVTGSGTLQAVGTATVNGTSAADKPTLGATWQIGDGTAATTTTFSANSQPLVVTGNAYIVVNGNALLYFNNQPLQQGSAAVAIANGDGNPHTLLVGGGQVIRTNTSECVVGMGLALNAGSALFVNPTPQGRDFGPLHFTGQTSGGKGMSVQGGAVYVDASLSVDAQTQILGGSVTVNSQSTLTLGVGPNSPASFISGGTLNL
jgi:hypothetical protein